MTARQRSSYRSGNLAEDLGILLLRGIAAVAEVPRPEDMGLDAIASLLRYADDGNCYAEDSFVIQIKAASTKEFEYDDFELQWFLGQELPMFIGLVSLRDSYISLYPTLYVNVAVFSLHATHATIRFGLSDVPSLFEGYRKSPWYSQSDHSVMVYLGEPLLRWSLSDVTEKSWRATTYQILKRFLPIARRERELLEYGQWTVLDWSTNNIDSICVGPMSMRGHPSEIKDIAKRCAPGVQALMMRALSVPGEEGQQLRMALIALASVFRDLGIDADPESFFTRLFSHRQIQSDGGPGMSGSA
jgi:hypothetical protein